MREILTEGLEAFNTNNKETKPILFIITGDLNARTGENLNAV